MSNDDAGPTSPAEGQPPLTEGPPKRIPAFAGWIGAASLLASGASVWMGGDRVGIISMILSAAMVTTGLILTFIMARRWFVAPEKDGRR